MRARRWFSGWFFGLSMLFFYAPLAVLVLFSFNASRTMQWEGCSLRWYAELFCRSRMLWRSVANSVVIAL